MISSHGLVLVEVARRPDATMHQIADRVGITERQTARILRDLREGGFIGVERVGRNNRYTVMEDQCAYAASARIRAGDLLAVLGAVVGAVGTVAA